jgi:hypothetical protein
MDQFGAELRKRQLLLKGSETLPEGVVMQIAAGLGSLAFLVALQPRRTSFLAIYTKPVYPSEKGERGPLRVVRPAVPQPIPRPMGHQTLAASRERLLLQGGI